MTLIVELIVTELDKQTPNASFIKLLCYGHMTMSSLHEVVGLKRMFYESNNMCKMTRDNLEHGSADNWLMIHIMWFLMYTLPFY